MTVSSSSSPREGIAGYQVEAPRAEDAIGGALRQAYARDLGLPDDMAALLNRLDSKRSNCRSN